MFFRTITFQTPIEIPDRPGERRTFFGDEYTIELESGTIRISRNGKTTATSVFNMLEAQEDAVVNIVPIAPTRVAVKVADGTFALKPAEAA